MNTDSWNDRATIQAMRRDKHEQQIEDFREVLKWYAEETRYGVVWGKASVSPIVEKDGGKNARDVLDKYSQEEKP